MSIVAQKSASIIPTGTWTIDPVWSALGFEIKKIGLAVIKGRALDFEGTIRGGDAPSIEGKAAVSSITTFDETRDAHLQSPDFFDAERYPELRFESTRVEARGNQLIVDGELTIKGVATPVELRGHYEGGGTAPRGNARIEQEPAGPMPPPHRGLK